MWTAVCAADFFSLLLCQIRGLFEGLISICKESTNRKQPSFAAVLELLIFSSLIATVFLVLAVFISGEHHEVKRHMDEFAYVRTMVGLAVAWQIYWVGIVGLVFVDSAVFSNVISVCSWPVVSLLVALFYSKYDQFHVLSGTALATAAISVGSYFYLIHKDKNDDDEDTN
ncbi:unnamed protein product [Microthlaspi erraticum]|uniref:Uncharacterized protein n=1 Tax=Microthlaspi erraticum TaxID=1685480 RepID=A0A6D2JTH4_9BRAS|nr:unnamed protein product [Microthlaspi erraticum]